MAVADCIAEIQAAHGGGLSSEDARKILDAVDTRAERLARTRGLNFQEAVRQAVKELQDAEAAQRAIAKHNALLNLQKRIERRGKIEATAADVGKQLGRGMDLATAIRNQVRAIATPSRGGRLSAEAVWKTREKEYLGAIWADLKRSGLHKVVAQGKLEREWGKELFELSRGERGNPGISGSKEAQQIAEILAKYQALNRERLNREGAWIGHYDGYITKTAHDPDKIRRVGPAAWMNDIIPLMDDATFDGVEEPISFMRDLWNDFVTGVHLSDERGVGMKDPAFTGPLNMAKAASSERVLHFKDADAWLDYQHKYGSGSLFEQYLGSLQRGARQEALMSRWGTNPQAEFDQDFRWAREKWRGDDPAHLLRLKDREKSIRREWSWLVGEATRPEHRLAAQIGAGVRTVESMAKLGLVVFTHIPVAAQKASELRYQGIGLFERWGNFLHSFLITARAKYGDGETMKVADLLHAGIEGAQHSLLNRFSPDDTVPGTLSKTQGTFFKFSILPWLLDAQKLGTMYALSRELGQQVETSAERLSPHIQRAFLQYDISPAEWDALRAAENHPAIDGRAFVTPDAAHRAAPEAIGRIAAEQGSVAMSEAREAAIRDRLALKLHAYYADNADRGVITPGIAEKAMVVGANQPGSAVGEITRFLAQFKMWGIAAQRQGFGRELYGGQGVRGAASGIAQMVVGAGVLGYLAMSLKDLAKGQNPRPPNDPKTWFAALAQGGGFGIMGDYLFGEYNRFGQDFTASLAGPVIGQGATAILNLWNEIKAGETRDIPASTWRLVENNMPFINLFYTRLALDYLFLHSVQETLSPGYLRRFERSIKTKNDQTFWLSPQNHLHTFGR